MKTKRQRRRELDRLSCYAIVWARAKRRCERCGIRIGAFYPDWHPQHAHMNHKVPLSKGGEDTPENCELICGGCHMPGGQHAPTADRKVRFRRDTEWP